jgi:hypothetical protein
MPDKKKDLAALLGGNAPKPAIRKGTPLGLSTESAPAAAPQERTIATSQNSEIAQSQKRTNAETQDKPKRVNRGYMLREDLIRDMRVLAVQEGRNLYEVMEEAFESYLERRRQA